MLAFESEFGERAAVEVFGRPLRCIGSDGAQPAPPLATSKLKRELYRPSLVTPHTGSAQIFGAGALASVPGEGLGDLASRPLEPLPRVGRAHKKPHEMTGRSGERRERPTKQTRASELVNP